MDSIELVEVGPRDGLQNIKEFIPTETKIRLIKALAAAGFKGADDLNLGFERAIHATLSTSALTASSAPCRS